VLLGCAKPTMTAADPLQRKTLKARQKQKLLQLLLRELHLLMNVCWRC
jgi:hypothetical protein